MSEKVNVSIPDQIGILGRFRNRRVHSLLKKLGATESPESGNLPKGVIPYDKFCEKYPQMLPEADGDLTKGEFRRLTDPEEIRLAVEASDGFEPVAYDGPYSFFAVHPVQRPDGSYGLYHQVGWKFEAEGRTGCVTIPVWDDNGVKKIGLVKHYRPPISGVDGTGGWYAEVPRFSQKKGKTVRETIDEESLSELNADIVGEAKRLDAPEDTPHGIAMENAISSQMNPVWFVPVEPRAGNPRELEEGITGRVFLTLDEYRQALQKGDIEIDGQLCSTHEAHSFLALHYAQENNLL